MTAPTVPPPLPPVPAAADSPVDRARQAATEAEKSLQVARAAAHQRHFELDRLTESLEVAKGTNDVDSVGELVARRAALEAELGELTNMVKRREMELETRKEQAERIERQALIQGELVRHEQRQLDHQRQQAAELRRQAAVIESTLYAVEERVAAARADLVRLVGDLDEED